MTQPPKEERTLLQLSPEDLLWLANEARAPDNYQPGLDPILDHHLMKRTNKVWKKLGHRHGFIWDSARPVEGYGPEFVSVIMEKPSDAT